MSEDRVNVVNIPLTITFTDVVQSKSVKINRNGKLVYADMQLSSSGKSAADMFLQLSVTFRVSGTTITLITGYGSASQGDGRGIQPFWHGNVPVDTETIVNIAYLNASGESQRLSTNLVIENE